MSAKLLRFQATEGDNQVSVGARLQAISKEVQEPLLLSPGGFIPNRDPVLRILAPAAGLKYCDERVWFEMEREHKLYDARRHLESEIFATDFEVQVGASGLPAADLLREFCHQMWCRIPQRRTVLKRLHDSYYWGWRPMQVLADTEASFRGRPVWSAGRIVDKPPHRVRFTEAGSLIWNPSFLGEAIEFRGDARRLGWLTWSVGSLSEPYGRGLHHYSFMLWYAKRQIFRRFNQGVDRQLGMVKVLDKKRGPELAENVEEVKKDLAVLLDFLNAHNILYETGQWTLEFLDSIDFVSAGLEALRYFDDAMMTMYCGETLTSKVGDQGIGSFAAAKVHRAVKSDYARDAALETVEGPMTQLFHTFIEANFGEVDPDDLPRFVSKRRLQVDRQAVKDLFDMGAGIRAEALADRWGARDVLADGDEDPDELILQKPSMPAGGIFSPAGEEEGKGEEGQNGDRRRLLRTAEQQGEHVDGILSASIERGRPKLQRYLDELADSWLARHGFEPRDPKA